MRARRIVAALVAVGVTVTACGDRDAPAAETTGASAGSVEVSTGPTSGSPAATAPTVTAPAPGAYVAGTDRRAGTRGPVTFDVGVPTLSGGSTAVTEKFNASMRASLDDHLRVPEQTPGTMTVEDGRLADGRRSGVTRLGPGVVAGVLLTNGYISGGAHPTNVIGTVVIATGTARPVLLTDLFTAPDTGLSRLAELVKQRAQEAGTSVFVSEPERDLANWIPTDEGLTVFAGVTHAEGDYRGFTVPWAELKDVIAPAMWPVLTA
ncbi:hypothetical protein TPB0596_43050 [Tsukamurella pulmonis]|uniref:DUF3298 domain-containing protein n=1 Tax=Tsukamurella pulmonis TaxID=47312 RepID=A0A1H1BA46_9ACTN|nr:RsiV family protein [Tsukamurella pulmonis]KXO94091.1 hypothetical protein AXK56_21080 [Tsukamurella pulmonis]KXP11924.1 hypothetical protein AXK57_20345 [Tsukamurella pulmonis]RDH12706.1 hypothetical protein DVB88_05975 [Tsukamurella pulmonis]SDQ48701.1 hypothetical protein SAMN04489765_0607 [Tsukamurella pulmonis]SUP25432.1 Protein of uncharacterised function (DUF3298) [Tsukamurella pulmonis]